MRSYGVPILRVNTVFFLVSGGLVFVNVEFSDQEVGYYRCMVVNTFLRDQTGGPEHRLNIEGRE